MRAKLLCVILGGHDDFGGRKDEMKLRELFTARDMTEGAPWKRIMEFAVPMLIGNLAQQLYNTVDSIVVGKYVGDHALAAVGTCMPMPAPVDMPTNMASSRLKMGMQVPTAARALS